MGLATIHAILAKQLTGFSVIRSEQHATTVVREGKLLHTSHTAAAVGLEFGRRSRLTTPRFVVVRVQCVIRTLYSLRGPTERRPVDWSHGTRPLHHRDSPAYTTIDATH